MTKETKTNKKDKPKVTCKQRLAKIKEYFTGDIIFQSRFKKYPEEIRNILSDCSKAYKGSKNVSKDDVLKLCETIQGNTKLYMNRLKKENFLGKIPEDSEFIPLEKLLEEDDAED